MRNIVTIADEKRRGPQPGNTRVAAGVDELRTMLVEPPEDSGAFVVQALRDIQARLERVEAAIGGPLRDQREALSGLAEGAAPEVPEAGDEPHSHPVADDPPNRAGGQRPPPR
jgi:hypothetical protein